MEKTSGYDRFDLIDVGMIIDIAKGRSEAAILGKTLVVTHDRFSTNLFFLQTALMIFVSIDIAA